MKINKKDLLKKFLIFPKQNKTSFFAREMKLLNDLISRYSDIFVYKLTFPKKFDSLAILLSESFKKELDLKFKLFSYKTNDDFYEEFAIKDEKFGETILTKKRTKTIKDFLNG